MDIFQQFCKKENLPIPLKEYKFHPKRKWRIDYAWPEQRIAIEVEGGAWIKGRHTRGVGFLSDIEKYNNLTLFGWKLIRTIPKELNTVQIIEMIKKLMEKREYE